MQLEDACVAEPLPPELVARHPAPAPPDDPRPERARSHAPAALVVPGPHIPEPCPRAPKAPSADATASDEDLRAFLEDHSFSALVAKHALVTEWAHAR